MRIDLFLKVSGLLKTRSIASRAIDSGSVTLDGTVAKASQQIQKGSVISLIKPDGTLVAVVVETVPETKNVSAKNRAALYRILERRD
jgi:ribosomal 50S subunit-recycling heat shock protein